MDNEEAMDLSGKNVVITNAFGIDNRGDWELLSQTINKISSYKPRSISIISNSTVRWNELDKNINIFHQPLVIKQKTVFSPALKVIYFLLSIISIYFSYIIHLLPKNSQASLKILINCDIAVCCAGGYLEDSGNGIYSHLLQILILKILGKKYILAPMSIGPVRTLAAKVMLKYILKGADIIYVREKYSYELVKSLNLCPELCADLAIYSDPDIKWEPNKDKKYICFTAVKWSFPKSKNPHQDKVNYVHQIAIALNTICKSQDTELCILLQTKSDLPVVDEITKLLDIEYRIEYCDRGPSEIKSILSKSDGLIASRLHSGLFALSIGCPFLAISYLPKTESILEMLGLEQNQTSIYGVTAKEIVENFYSVTRKNNETIKIFRKKMETLNYW